MTTAGKHILIVGGLEKERVHYKNLLEKLPGRYASIELTDSGRQGLTLSEQHELDCILLDFCLFDIDGLDFIKQLRQQGTSTAILILNEANQETPIELALAAGAQDSVLKSECTAEALHQAITKAVSKAPKLNKSAVQKNNKATTRKQRRQLSDSKQSTENSTADFDINQHLKPQCDTGQTDSITGLPNHILFKQSLSQIIAHRDRQHGLMTLLLIDIVNLDSLRQQYDDAIINNVIKEIAVRCHDCLRRSDILARLGDLGIGEFGIILDQISSYVDAGYVARRIVSMLATPIESGQHSITLDAVIGITCYPIDCCNPTDFHKNAVVAMYYAKDTTERCHFFNRELNDDFMRKIKIQALIKQAFADKEFYLTYQPIVNLRTYEINYLDVNIEWQHQELGAISAHEFIPIAKTCNLLIPFGSWLIDSICHEMTNLKDQAILPEKILITLETAQLFDKDFIQKICHIFSNNEFAADKLVIKIDEASLLDNPGLEKQALRPLAEQGVHFCLANFASEHTSFQNLKNEFFDSIEISAAFIEQSQRSGYDRVITENLINIGNQLNLNVIANGIDNQATVDFLLQLNCPYGKGEYLCPPSNPRSISQSLQTSTTIFLQQANAPD